LATVFTASALASCGLSEAFFSPFSAWNLIHWKTLSASRLARSTSLS